MASSTSVSLSDSEVLDFVVDAVDEVVVLGDLFDLGILHRVHSPVVDCLVDHIQVSKFEFLSTIIYPENCLSSFFSLFYLCLNSLKL